MISKERYAALMARVSPCPNTGCWFWMGALRTGYGAAEIDGRMRALHVVTYEQEVGEVSEGLELDHLCRVRGCCNPHHVEPVTHQENMRRSPLAGLARGQQQRSKTHCPEGHAYEGDNLLIHEGRRRCLTCWRRTCREAQRRYQARKKGLHNDHQTS